MIDTTLFHHKIDKLVRSKPIVIYSELSLLIWVTVLVDVCYMVVMCWVHWGRVTVSYHKYVTYELDEIA